MNIIHINSKTKTIEPVSIPDDEEGCYDAIVSLIEGHFCLPYMFSNGDVLYAWDDYIDPETIASPPKEGFSLSGGHQNFYPGSAVVVGTRGSIEVDTKSELNTVKKLIKFKKSL